MNERRDARGIVYCLERFFKWANIIFELVVGLANLLDKLV